MIFGTNILFKLVSIAIVITTGHGHPFLYDSSKVLPLAVTYSSTSEKSSYIADLRLSKTEQFNKIQETEDENQGFFINLTNESTPNQILPGIVQKKLAKIFAKLQVLSSLSNSNKYGDNADEKSIDAFNDEPFPVTTNNSILFNGNYSTEQFAKLMNSADVPRQNFMPITLRRIFESIVNLTYRMLSATAAKDTVADTV